MGLLSLPDDLLKRIVAALPTPEAIGRADCLCKAFHDPPPEDSQLRQGSVVEEALRLRAENFP